MMFAAQWIICLHQLQGASPTSTCMAVLPNIKWKAALVCSVRRW